MAIKDGLGFEEVNQSGLDTILVQAVSGAFTRVDGGVINATTSMASAAYSTAGSAGISATISGVKFLNGLAVLGP